MIEETSLVVDTWTITSVGCSPTDLGTRIDGISIIDWPLQGAYPIGRCLNTRPALYIRQFVRGAYDAYGHYNAPVIIYEAWPPGFPGVAIYRYPAEFLPLVTGYRL